MANPIFIKLAVAAATDKRTQKFMLSVAAGAIALILLPIFLVVAVMSGEAKSSQSIAEIIFYYERIPSRFSAEEREYIRTMQDAFKKLDIELDRKNREINDNDSSLDAIQIKAVFYVLYFGTDLSDMEDGFYADFVNAFTEIKAEDGAEKTIVIKVSEKVYAALSELIGREISQNERISVNSLYWQMRYGYAAPGGNYGIPGEAFNDETFAMLMAEATKYIGYPYVWGGSTPSESFDCSGFVCWAYTQSGVYNLPRGTAQSIFDQCTVISKDELMPGDLVFFTKTYESVNDVTHVGIYVGEGRMLHAGSPIGYADFNSSYWRKHFYAFGRLSGIHDKRPYQEFWIIRKI